MTDVRRKHKRVRNPAKVEFKHKDKAKPVETESINISREGVCLPLPDKHPRGKEAEVKVHLPTGKVSATGKVAWTRTHATIWGTMFETGIQLTKMTSAHAKKIGSFVRGALKGS